jgi:hypothetical protein
MSLLFVICVLLESLRLFISWSWQLLFFLGLKKCLPFSQRLSSSEDPSYKQSGGVWYS